MALNNRGLVEIPISMIHDGQIRSAVEWELRRLEVASTEDILVVTKKLEEEGRVAVLACGLDWPFRAPALSYVGVDMGSNNQEIKVFAFDAWDFLQDHYYGHAWEDSWEVITYFGDKQLELGLFV